MKLYASTGPNPRVVTMFIAEKGLDVPLTIVDVRAGENRREPYITAVNPAGQTPALDIGDGVVLSEITAICEYLEERHPTPPLIGRTAAERAVTRMWTRRIDLRVCEPLTSGFRFAEGLGLFQSRVRCLPEAAAGMKALTQDGLAWLEANVVGPWIVGDRFTLADILLFAFLEFGAGVGQAMDPASHRLAGWYERVKSRPGAARSVGAPLSP